MLISHILVFSAAERFAMQPNFCRFSFRSQHISTAKRNDKKAEVDRRSVNDDFFNCFLSPVQCMLPRMKR
ncbi:unnamed protein product [Haemonchus placei]|uniref:Uncharacterized protein n=1 Tax=Haemonchus placei TaxID=6290 RepID=A0A3P7X271_HAEPC|nr:unnamed protein product [Haemonchus placei]